ncbi:MAG TPA: hypothetical protein VIX89_18160 [Bryobacteraceae bacterium]
MRFRFQPWQLAVVLVAVCVAVVAGIYKYRVHGGSSPASLVSYLPAAHATVVYLDVRAMRRSGLLNMIGGSKTVHELEYQQFLDETLFDYRMDLDAVAAAFRDDQVFIALRGRFHWKNLMEYVVRQGGSCHNGYCSMPASQPRRWISFYPIRPNVMAMAFGADDSAAYQIMFKSSKLIVPPFSQPVWMSVPASALRNSDALPSGAKPFASALLEGTNEIVFTIGQDGDHLALSLNVLCRDTQSASTLFESFEKTTATLRKWIAREHQQPNPSDWSGLLAAGSFRREDQRVFGQWPLSRAFVEAQLSESF